MALKFYTSVAKGSELKVRKLCEVIPSFVEVTEEMQVLGGWGLGVRKGWPPPILNRVDVAEWANIPNFFPLLNGDWRLGENAVLLISYIL